MVKRQIFSVTTPLGYRVSLTRDRWKQITRFKHPAMMGLEGDARKCLQDPDIVRESAKDPHVHLYYKQTSSATVCVVAAPSGGNEDRFVVTAYLTDKIKEGNEIWKK